ncbi:MAG TPA: hypothetical protein VI259_04730, partial [Gemmatimonadaceae bacterium]
MKRWLALALLIAGCGTSTLPPSGPPAPTPVATPAPSLPTSSASATTATAACQTSVRFLAAFANRFGGELAGLRPLILATPFDSGATWTRISELASTLREYDGLEDQAAACPATSGLSDTVATLREQARSSIDRSAAGSVNDNALQRAV